MWIAPFVTLALILMGCGPSSRGRDTGKVQQPVPAETIPRTAFPRHPDLTDEYRSEVKEWGQGTLFKGKTEEKVYKDVKKNNMHYLYVAFLEMFPNSSHRDEIQGRLANFYVFEAAQITSLSVKDLKEQFGYDEANTVYYWSKHSLATIINTGQQQVWSGPICLGNLQFIAGGFTVEDNAIGLLPGTRFIYRLEIPGLPVKTPGLDLDLVPSK